MNKPRIFIGSSVEGLNVAKAIQQNLDHFAETTIWQQNIFQLSTPALTSLIKAVNSFDFGIFIFYPDDLVKIRGNEHLSVRDNVIFETGLFIGKLGMDKVYFVKPRNQDLHLPTDLLGIETGDYEANRTDGNLVASTGTFCTRVETIIKEIISKPILNDENQKVLQFEKDLKIIKIYLEEKKWSAISFEKLMVNINKRYTEEYIREIINAFPEKIRTSKLGEGRHGIALVKEK